MELLDRVKRSKRYGGLLAALLLMSIAVAVAGFVSSLYYGAMWNSAVQMEEAAGGLDVCTERDGTGRLTNRAFVEAGEPCPEADEWRTVERTANADLADPAGPAYMVPPSAAVLAAGIAGVVLVYRAYDRY